MIIGLIIPPKHRSTKNSVESKKLRTTKNTVFFGFHAQNFHEAAPPAEARLKINI